MRKHVYPTEQEKIILTLRLCWRQVKWKSSVMQVRHNDSCRTLYRTSDRLCRSVNIYWNIRLHRPISDSHWPSTITLWKRANPQRKISVAVYGQTCTVASSVAFFFFFFPLRVSPLYRCSSCNPVLHCCECAQRKHLEYLWLGKLFPSNIYTDA